MSDRDKTGRWRKGFRNDSDDSDSDTNKPWFSMDSPITWLVLGLLFVIVLLLGIFVMCYAQKRRRRRSRRDHHERGVFHVFNETPTTNFPNGYMPGQYPHPTTATGCQMCNHNRSCNIGSTVGMPGHRVANGTNIQHQHSLAHNIGAHSNGNHRDVLDNGQRRVYSRSEFTASCENGRRPHSECCVTNPAFNESFDDDSASHSEHENNCINERLEELYKLTERSFTQIVQNKQVVSIARKVRHEGETLYLDNMGIKLQVPKGAVKEGECKLITLVLNWDLSDNPDMKIDQSLVSPVVYVGPHGLKLQKPCVLTFRHCAFDPRQIKVMRSETELIDEKRWQPLSDQDGVTRLSSEECNIDVDTFTLYTCIQAPIEDRVGKKWLQIAMFACPLRRNITHHQVRVYFLNKTPCALQWAIQHEAEFGGKLVCPEKVFLFDGGKLDMLAKIRYLSSGWELVESDYIEKISFIKIWHGHCPHISVCFKRASIPNGQSTHTTVAIEMSLHIFTYQNAMEKDGEKLVVHISEDNLSPSFANEPICPRHHLEELVIDVNQFDHAGSRIAQSHHQIARPYVDSMTHVFDGPAAGPSQVLPSNTTVDGLRHSGDTTDSNASGARLKVVVNTKVDRDTNADVDDMIRFAPKREIPQEIRRKLQCLLDPEKTTENDWRDFAGKLECDGLIPVLRQKSYMQSPTETLLDIVQHNDMSLTQLQNMFRSMGREDCANVIDEFLHTNLKQRVPTENSGVQLYRGENYGHSRIRGERGKEHSWNILPESGVGSGSGMIYSRERGGGVGLSAGSDTGVMEGSDDGMHSSRENRRRDNQRRNTPTEYSVTHGVKHYYDNSQYP